jgi:uncharacterized membrane protein YccC
MATSSVKPISQVPATAAFAIRTTVATLLSLWVGFRLQLDFPYLGAVTIWLISKPGVRATIQLSAARFIGTLAGCLGAVVIMAVAAQAPVTALVLMALWLGACAAGDTLALAPSHSATFALAGFAILTAVAASVNDPNRSFLIAVDQCAGVCVGVACLFVVDALFPYRIDQPAIRPRREQREPWPMRPGARRSRLPPSCSLVRSGWLRRGRMVCISSLPPG